MKKNHEPSTRDPRQSQVRRKRTSAVATAGPASAADEHTRNRIRVLLAKWREVVDSRVSKALLNKAQFDARVIGERIDADQGPGLKVGRLLRVSDAPNGVLYEAYYFVMEVTEKRVRLAHFPAMGEYQSPQVKRFHLPRPKAEVFFEGRLRLTAEERAARIDESPLAQPDPAPGQMPTAKSILGPTPGTETSGLPAKHRRNLPQKKKRAHIMLPRPKQKKQQTKTQKNK